MRTQSLDEAELLAHGFHAPLHDGTATGDFAAKLSETGGVAHGFQERRISIATGSDPIGITPRKVTSAT